MDKMADISQIKSNTFPWKKTSVKHSISSMLMFWRYKDPGPHIDLVNRGASVTKSKQIFYDMDL